MTRTFPPGFLWGVTTGAHQTEGNNVASDWWSSEHAPGATVEEPSGDAADSYHRWWEDMDLAAGAGFTDYRFGIEWSRVEPADGRISHAEVARVVGQVPLIVTENGIATADDARRIAFTAAALDSLHAAMNDGVDVRGYLHWSLLDNYEWGSYRPTFGLVAVDRASFRRTPKPSLAWLGGQRP